MKELIKVTQNERGEQLVSGRELHQFLEVKSRFNDWIANRIKKYDFIENVDFVAVTKFLVTAQGNKSAFTDYVLKLDMAKELSMVENNEKGKRAREYFIQCERKLLESNNYNSLNARVTFLENAITTISKAVEVNAKAIETITNDIAPVVKLIARNTALNKITKTEYDDSVEVFAEEYIDVIFGRTNSDVYNDYINFCNNKNLDITNKITFGKRMKAALGCEIINKKINGKKYRIFIKN